jgi:hypothetical protein
MARGCGPVSRVLSRLAVRSGAGSAPWCCIGACRAGLRSRIVTILVIRGSGFLGAELIRQAAVAGQPTAATYATSPGNTTGDLWHHLDLRVPGGGHGHG